MMAKSITWNHLLWKVLLGHGVMLLFLVWGVVTQEKRADPHPKLFVQTVTLKPHQKANQQTDTIQPSKPKSIPKKDMGQKNLQQKVLSQVKEKISQLQKVPESSLILKSPSQVLVEKQISEDSILSEEERIYLDELISRLKLCLTLPEFGKVKISLTVKPDGKPADLKILHAESKRNQDYILEKLPSLTFSNPYKEKTFVIILVN